MVVTCSCPSCQHQTSVTAAAGAHCAPVSRLQLGYNSIPTADWGQPAAGLGAAAGAALAAGAGGSLSLHFVSVCGEAPRPSPPWPAPPAAPAAPRTPAPPLRPSAGRLYPAARQVRGRGTVGTVGMGLETEIVSSIGLPPGFLMWGRTNGRRPGQGVTVSPHLHHW